MANPLQVLIGGSSAGHQQREAQIMEASLAQQKPPVPAPQEQPVANTSMNPATGRSTFMSSAATTQPAPSQRAGATLLGQ